METAGVDLWVINVVALCVIGIMTLNGWRSGFVASFFGIVGFGVALWVGARNASYFAPMLGDEMPEILRFAIAFIGIVIVVSIVAGIITRFLNRIVRLPILGTVNGIGGAIFGAIKGFVVVALLAIGLTLFPLSAATAASYTEASVVQVSMEVTGTVITVLKPYFSQHLDEFVDVFREHLGHMTLPIPDAQSSGSTRI